MFGPEQDVLIHSTNAHVISHNASGTVQTRCLRSVARRRLTSRFSVFLTCSHRQSLAFSSHVQLPVFSLSDSIASGHRSKGADANLFQRWSTTSRQASQIGSYRCFIGTVQEAIPSYLGLFFCFFFYYSLLSQSCLQTCKMKTNQQMKLTENTHTLYWRIGSGSVLVQVSQNEGNNQETKQVCKNTSKVQEARSKKKKLKAARGDHDKRFLGGTCNKKNAFGLKAP